jgi:drug/metabolite transporter (DMT)-like permease
MMTTSITEQKIGELFFLSWQELATLASVALHSYCWIIVRILVKEKKYTPMTVNGIGMIAGGLIALITSYYVDGPLPIEKPLFYMKWFIVIVLISNVICHNLYAYLLRHYTATFMAFAGFLGPLFSALYAWGLLGEQITWHFFISSILIFIGLYLFYREELCKQRGLQTDI